MGARKNLIHEKLKRAKPEDLLNFQLKLPAYLLRDVKTYGDTSKVIRRALEAQVQNKRKHKAIALEIMSSVLQAKSLLEEEEEQEQIIRELIEIYKDCYFRIKDSGVVRKRKLS